DEAGMRPGWLGYIGVDDVDSAVAGIESSGGKVHMPAMDLDGVGRIALVADPQGLPFYVMRGSSEEASDSFDPLKPGRCSWNELSTPDPDGALAFYTGRFGWAKGDVMPMGEMGGYQFLEHGGGMIGAIMAAPPGRPAGWNFAFRVPGAEEAAARIKAAGGIVHHGPIEVPGGDWVVMATDPHGAVFMAVGARTELSNKEREDERFQA
ncbi:MAG TPA: VOC family protein, partial [Allosphingosinicella sp.]